MENTVIIKENGLAINSSEHVDYALVITDFSGKVETETLEGDKTGEILEQPPTIELRASRESGSEGGEIEVDVFISTLKKFVMLLRVLCRL